MENNLRATQAKPFLQNQMRATLDDFSEKLPQHYPQVPFYREWPKNCQSLKSFWAPIVSGYHNFLAGHTDFSIGLMLVESGKIVSLTAYSVGGSEDIHVNAGSPPIVNGRNIHLKNTSSDFGLCLIIGSQFLNHPETEKHKYFRQSGHELKDILSLISGSASMAIGHTPEPLIFQMIKMFARENGFVIDTWSQGNEIKTSGFILKKRQKLKVKRKTKISI